MSEMTVYQVALAEHMADAPQELREYVCRRLKNREGYKKGWHPISTAVIDSLGRISSEERIFWREVSEKNWKLALWSGFWQSRQANEPKPEAYDFINPPHYQKFSVEVIDMMVAIWGKEATALHCEMCAFKYRLRIGSKPNQSIEDELGKINWYMEKTKELRS